MNTNEQFEAIVNEHYESLFRFAMSLTRSESDACDLTQQTFYIWATKGHQLRDISRVKTWLFTTLHRAFIKTRRDEIKFPKSDLDGLPEQVPDLPFESLNDLDGSDVLLSLGRVDEIYRAAVALFYLEDNSYKAIAEILDVPIGTVKSRIARGIVQLRKILLSKGGALDADMPDGTLVPPYLWNTSILSESHMGPRLQLSAPVTG